MFNNKITPITIDTGANIGCIILKLLPIEYIITQSTILQLLGLDNKPIRTTGIYIYKKNRNNY